MRLLLGCVTSRRLKRESDLGFRHARHLFGREPVARLSGKAVKRRFVWRASKDAMNGNSAKSVCRITRILLWVSLLVATGAFASSAPAHTLIVPAAPRAASPPAASTAATLTFRRVFKESTPEFIEIIVAQDADKATYEIRQLDEDPEKMSFEI